MVGGTKKGRAPPPPPPPETGFGSWNKSIGLIDGLGGPVVVNERTETHRVPFWVEFAVPVIECSRAATEVPARLQTAVFHKRQRALAEMLAPHST